MCRNERGHLWNSSIGVPSKIIECDWCVCCGMPRPGYIDPAVKAKRWEEPRMRVLDLYCHRGGMAMGYHRAGFDVTGVDLDEECGQEYPFAFVHGDAIEYLLAHGDEFDLIHGSPPCQLYTPLNAYNHKTYPDLIGPTREAMLRVGKPYVMGNVEAARPEMRGPVMLCGPMFGLRMYRHRLLEASFPLTAPEHPKHIARCVRNGYLPTPERPFMSIHGGKHSKAWQRAAAEAMGTPWITTVKGVCEAIPPRYAQWVGESFINWKETNDQEGMPGLLPGQGVTGNGADDGGSAGRRPDGPGPPRPAPRPEVRDPRPRGDAAA